MSPSPDTPPRRPVPWGRLALATVAIGSIFAVAARDLSPQTPAWLAFAVGVGGTLLVVGGLLMMAGLKFMLNQAVLNAGGTDTQWLWFRQDPRGLSALRDKAGKP